MKATFPCTKENLFEFSKEHPAVLERYRDELAAMEKRHREELVDPDDEQLIAKMLGAGLESIPTGNANASDYHSLMLGVLEFLFYPNLLYPRKEQEIHEGRKRIDILTENGAHSGVFWRHHEVQKIPCAYVAFECKNYTTEVANPELDQLAGRFGVNRGMLGFLCCRHFEDRDRFVARCRDTCKDGRGLILPMDDRAIRR